MRTLYCIAAGPWSNEIGRMVDVDIPVVAVRGQMWASAPQPPVLRHAIAGAESMCHWSTDDLVDGEADLIASVEDNRRFELTQPNLGAAQVEQDPHFAPVPR